MKLTRPVLHKIYDAAIRQVRVEIKDRHQSHEEFVTSCWMQAAIDVCRSEGVILPIHIEVIKDFIIEPID